MRANVIFARMMNYPPALFLMGPTASGKTALSLALVDRYPLEIVSVDSALVYRGMDIGTSKPSQSVLTKYPHHLINICDPSNAYSVAEFREQALASMVDITERGKIPLLVGGTMLYHRALLYGISDMPEADANVRQMLEKEQKEHGLLAMHERLQRIDENAAKKIHPNDPQRIQRALEVYEISGIPISEWWERGNSQNLPYTVLKLAVTTSDRSILHDRIEKRFSEMLSEGFVEEVEGLKNRGDLTEDMPSMRSVGYRQIWQYLENDSDFDEMKFKGIVATRQLAKRQLTWLRSEPDLNWLYSDDLHYQESALKLMSQFPIA